MGEGQGKEEKRLGHKGGDQSSQLLRVHPRPAAFGSGWVGGIGRGFEERVGERRVVGIVFFFCF